MRYRRWQYLGGIYLTGGTDRYTLAAMAKVQVTLWGWKCERCGHEWLPRQQDAPEPRVCPKCKSPYWNRPRQRTATE